MEPRDRSIDNQPLLLGLDIGGTKTALILGDLEANVLCRVEIPTPAGEPFEPAIAKISAAAEALLMECKNEGSGIPKAVSVSVGGPLDIDRGILYAPPHLAAWGEAPLKASLEERLDLPVYVEHDGNAGAHGGISFWRRPRVAKYGFPDDGDRAGRGANSQRPDLSRRK